MPERGGTGGRRGHAPAWRTVAASVLAGVVLVTVSCSGGGDESDDAATASGPTSTTAETTTTTAVAAAAEGVPLSSVAWGSLRYPVDCEGEAVASPAAYSEPEPGTELAVVFVTCASGAGAQPSAVLVYDRADSTDGVHLAQTLLSYEDNWTPTGGAVEAMGSDLVIPVYGYSTDDIPRCCPDLDLQLTWTWREGEYVATGPQPPHAELPPA